MTEEQRPRRKARIPSVDWRRVPFGSIFVTVGAVVAVYLVGKVLYQLRQVILIMIVGGLVAPLVNPLVLVLQRSGIRRRSIAVGIVTAMTVLVFAGLAVLFGTSLVNGSPTSPTHSLTMCNRGSRAMVGSATSLGATTSSRGFRRTRPS